MIGGVGRSGGMTSSQSICLGFSDCAGECLVRRGCVRRGDPSRAC